MKKSEFKSEITCSFCGFRKSETMPVESCLFFYLCSNCEVIIRPKPGECCVFCSYASVVCPPMHKARQTERE
ncbi:MAG: hypothetical protein M3521_14040 [Acidobacteriota bacterium]|nr:hypothetical protein [Acidobacteriota bacterium]